MRKFKRIAAAIISTITVASMCIANTVSATNYTDDDDCPQEVPNTQDTNWYAGAGLGNFQDYCREKHTNTSVYVYNQSQNHGVYVNVYGRNQKFSGEIQVPIYGYHTVSIYIPVNRYGEIYQSIHENNHPYAYIKFFDADSAPGAAYGLWSPDCAGHYDVLNRN